LHRNAKTGRQQAFTIETWVVLDGVQSLKRVSQLEIGSGLSSNDGNVFV
jgi:hypothetical protein